MSNKSHCRPPRRSSCRSDKGHPRTPSMSNNFDKIVKLACKPKNAPPKAKVSSAAPLSILVCFVRYSRAVRANSLGETLTLLFSLSPTVRRVSDLTFSLELAHLVQCTCSSNIFRRWFLERHQPVSLPPFTRTQRRRTSQAGLR